MDMWSEIKDLISASQAESVAVGHYEVQGELESTLLPDEPFHAASTMKVCVLIELFHQVETGEASLDETLEIRNEFKSIADGSPFRCAAEDDSEHSLYLDLGKRATMIRLARPMITHSSNLATNLLVDRLGADRINRFMKELGASGISVLRGVEDGKAYRLGMNNTVTARGLTTLLAKLVKGEVVSPNASKQIIDILVAQTHRNGIPSGVPAHTRVANKPGWNNGICHDIAIVYPRKHPPYVLTVLTRGIEQQKEARELIASISAIAFKHRK